MPANVRRNDPLTWRARFGALLAGAALGLGQAPFDFPWVIFAALPALFLLQSGRGPWRCFWIGWWAGLGYFALTLHWIVEPFLVDLARTGWMAPFALVMKAGGHALFWALGFGLARALAGQGRGAAMALAATWTLAECARATILTGFPWALLAYIWIDTPVAQVLALIGPHGLGFLTLILGFLPVLAGRVRPGGAAVMLVLGAGIWIWGDARMPERAAGSVTNSGINSGVNSEVTLRLVQPNAAQHLKWQPDMVPVFFERMMQATAAEGAVDAVIWPEVAVPYLIDERPDLNARIAAANPGAEIILGARRVERGDQITWFNSLAVLDPEGGLRALYDKHHLVPFGEFLPFPNLWERFGLRALAAQAGRFSAGAGPVTLTLGTLPGFQPLICYEAIFPTEILGGAARPDWLLHITNDAWFGTFSGPYQHLEQAQARAIEQGLPLARAANTGVSAMIDPYGRITASLPLNTDGHLDIRLPRPLAPTIYARWGDWPAFAMVFAGLLAGFALRRRAKHG